MRWTFILLILILMPNLTLAQESNAGFVEGLWYSDTVFAEQPVRVYVALRNHTGADLSGRVTFTDNGQTIGSQTVQALDGRIIEAWADWEPEYGSHTLTATLSRVTLHEVGSAAENIAVQTAVAEDTIFADFDTDGDGVGNKEDADDDGDGISDAVEEENDTDPLVYTEPEPTPVLENVTATSSSETTGATSATADQPNTDTPQGLERYLTNSPARTTLTNLTSVITTAKSNLDTYRSERTAAQKAELNPEPISVDDGGFGTVTRSSSSKREVRTPELKEGGVVASVISLIGLIISSLYTALLFALSGYLTYPMLVQISLLLLILFVVYRLAKKYGSRKQ